MRTIDLYNAFRNAGYKIDVNSLPDYGRWNKGQWIEFHSQLKKAFGRKSANLVWRKFWDNEPVGLFRKDVFTADESFRSYFRKQGINFDENYYTILDEIAGFPATVVKTTLIAGGVTVAVILGIVGVVLYNESKKGNLSTIMKAYLTKGMVK